MTGIVNGSCGAAGDTDRVGTPRLSITPIMVCSHMLCKHQSLVELTTLLKDVQNLVHFPPEMHLPCSNPGMIAASQSVVLIMQ